MLKVAITGSAGKTGKFVLKEFERHGYETSSIDISGESAKSNARGIINSRKVDLRILSESTEVFEGVDAVVYLANLALPFYKPASNSF